jgi:hypothetical protein
MPLLPDEVQHPAYGPGRLLDRYQDPETCRQVVIIRFDDPPHMVHTGRAQIVPVITVMIPQPGETG